MEPATRFDPSSNELLPRGRFRGVVVAGTFDRFHDGHRTLLRAAVAMVAATPDKGGEDTITSSSGGGGSSSCIVVGIADGPLLSKKYLSEMIQPYNERKEVAEKFLQQELQRQGKAPGLVRLDFAPIQDPVPERGGSDPSLDCIVVSEETVGGAAAINRMRAANQIIPLHVVVASTVPAPSTAALPLAPATTSTAADISKLSSSLLREQCLGTFLPLPSKQKRQRRQHKGRLQAGPYLVGLTGGIASGKSTVARLLCSLASSSSSSSAPTAAAASPSAAATVSAAVPIEPEGSREAAREGWHSEEREAGQGRHSEEGGAGQGRQWRVGAVDCDRLAHRAYEPGTPAYRRIVELFGASVVRAADGQIDRAALGAQVFSCPEKMAALTGVVWPMVRQIVEEEREAAGAGGWEVTFESPKKATNCEKAPTSSEFTGGASTFSECTEKASASETCRNSFTIRPIAPPAAVLIVEAAMMVEAGSDQTVDEVWVVFVPEAEAKARLMARNGVTEEEAGKRIAAQVGLVDGVGRLVDGCLKPCSHACAEGEWVLGCVCGDVCTYVHRFVSASFPPATAFSFCLPSSPSSPLPLLFLPLSLSFPSSFILFINSFVPESLLFPSSTSSLDLHSPLTPSTTQMTSSARLAHADVAIYNGASEDATRHQLERAWSEVATQRAGPCLEQWNENFNRLQEQWSISSGNPHSMAAHMQPHFLEAARSVWTRWAALMWRLDVDADVAERWFLKLVLVEEGVRGEKEGEKAGEEGGQQVGVAGGWVAAVIVCFQHLRRCASVPCVCCRPECCSVYRLKVQQVGVVRG
ncbi:unnamed protein product [Closterium sp. NIES-65]|nr:unnamed protein product [Closterium sp. NIES-65]